MRKVNLAEASATFQDLWSPRIVAELNDSEVKLVKLRGEFEWHHHAQEDELFLVVHGRMVIHLREQDVALGEGEFFIVPRGVEHKPEAAEECWVLLLEPKGTLNTGNVVNARTVAEPQRI